MSSFLPSIAVSFLITVVFIVAFRPLAVAIGMVDLPGGRKAHLGEIPIVGGAAMFLGILIGIALLPASGIASGYLPISLALLVAIGLLDDGFSVPATARLITQASVVLIMVFGAGLQLDDLGNTFGFGTVRLGSASLLVTLLVTVAVTNAFNLVDGVDGLCGTLVIIALSSVVIVSGGANSASMIALVTMSSVAAYLIFNFPLAVNRSIRCFMGDAGSTLLGFIVVWTTLSISQGPDRVISPVIGLWFASIPIYDIFTCFVRRILKGHSPFKPGRDHFHHTLKRGGLNVRQVVGTLIGLQVLYSGAGILAFYSEVPDVVMFLAWATLGLSQRWIIQRIALVARLNSSRQRPAGETGKYARPGTF